MTIQSAKYRNTPEGTKEIIIVRKGVESYVPISEDNVDYQNILKWVEEGNTIEEAD